MIKICVAGALGKMGKRIIELASLEKDFEIASAFDLPEFSGKLISIASGSAPVKEIVLGKLPEEEIAKADVLIDFTRPDASTAHVEIASKLNKGIVIGTTGLSPSQENVLKKCAETIPIVYAPNMSVGVNLLFKLVREVAEVLGLDYNVEIVEIHHNQKKDSPSGTALRLAKEVAQGLNLSGEKVFVYGREGLVGPRNKEEIGILAVRGGDVVGEHSVYFIGQGERLQLTHIAHSRDNFARGALRASRFVSKAQPGLYDMMDVLGLK
ncbi:MAG: 4-hydroxy-tetrahydrodipicolinate reductase [Candidatus Hydrogenedentes bacterium]|nr:4-hydroxy-tetrahydrodipicolinate reductase [Candidatus Hydrogenedentota bacterium]